MGFPSCPWSNGLGSYQVSVVALTAKRCEDTVNRPSVPDSSSEKKMELWDVD
jgi:hypothetical protein